MISNPTIHNRKSLYGSIPPPDEMIGKHIGRPLGSRNYDRDIGTTLKIVKTTKEKEQSLINDERTLKLGAP